MIKIRLAKSAMENEEGMNHLWIHIEGSRQSEFKHKRILLDLPEGIFRLENLSGYKEDRSGYIYLDKERTHDIFIEIYTVDPIVCQNYFINVYFENVKTDQKSHDIVPIEIVDVENAGQIQVDEEVTQRVMKLKQARKVADYQYTVAQPYKPILIKNEMSELEKKYRVDY